MTRGREGGREGEATYLLVFQLQVPALLLQHQGVVHRSGVEDGVEVHMDQVIEILRDGGREGGREGRGMG